MGFGWLAHPRTVDECRDNAPFITGRQIIDNIRILAATLLAATTCAAQAQSADAAPTHWHVGVQVGAVKDHSKTDPAIQATFGYDINSTFAVEALAGLSLLFIRTGEFLDPGEREYDSTTGLRVLATLPLDDHWRVVGGLGVVNFGDDVGTATSGHHDTSSKTTPMVSASLMYRKSRHFSFGVEAASFTSSHASSVGLKSEWHF